jgi:hypothetical protein
MKRLLKKITYFVFLFTLIIQGTLASDRTEAIFNNDATLALDLLNEQKEKLEDFRSEVSQIDFHLQKSKKGQAIYLRFDKIAGSLVIVGAIIGSYKAHFPPGFRVMLSAYTTVTGVEQGMIKLNEKYVKIFIYQVQLLNKRLDIADKKIAVQAAFYCKNKQDHELCDNNQ